MKLLMTTDTAGDVWTYALELAAALAPYNLDVILATMGPALTPAQLAEVAALPHVSLRTSTFALEWMRDPWDDVARAGEWLLAIERAEHPDVIHLNHYAFGPLPWLAPVVMVAHGCACSWWGAVNRNPVPPELSHYRDVVRRGLSAADLVVAPTAAVLDAMRPHYPGFPHARVIYNARSVTPHSDTTPTRERSIFSAGRLWDQGTNVQALRYAAETLEWPVRIAGPLTGPAGEAAEIGRLQALGELSRAHIAEEMRRAAVYAMPARYAPLDLTALEAAHAGCALVLGDTPPVREVWRNAAVFVQPDDVASLHTAVDTLMHDDGLRTCLADRAYQRALCFSPAAMASSYVDAYATVSPARAQLA